MFGDGYRCDRCVRGWHATPTCPYPNPSMPMAPSLVELTRQIHSVNRVGEQPLYTTSAARRRSQPLPPVQPPPWAGMRWWWPVAALVVFVALVILI